MTDKSFSKEERSWIMYDWANSVFATIMVAAVFPVFFVGMAGGEDSPGSMWWGWGTSAARFVVGISAPILGAVLDYKGYKKKLFVSFVCIGVLITLLLSVQSSWQMLLVGYILANMFWSAGNFIYDSYLPDITAKERMDKVSAWGFAMGYIGGSTIPFTVSIILVLFGNNFGIDNILAVRISIVMTAVWWFVFSIPMFRNVRHKYGVPAPARGLIIAAFKNALKTARKIRRNKGLFFFIVAYFFYIDGVGTVINMATAYGTELGLDAGGLITALFVTQIVAFPFTILFGRLAARINPLNLITGAICVYLCICLVGFFMGFGLNNGWFNEEAALVLFWAMAALVGTVQGGIQAISRSTFGRLVPPENSGEFFGFFEIFGRFAAILGPLLYATVLHISGRPDFSILSIILIFGVGLVILTAGRKHINAHRSS